MCLGKFDIFPYTRRSHVSSGVRENVNLTITPTFDGVCGMLLYIILVFWLECDEEYIGETARTFGERFKEHLKAPSPIYDHNNITGHSTTLNNFNIMGREEQNLSRLIKESMYIRVNNPSLNRNIGKYHLPHIWDEVLVNNTELKLK